MGRAPPLGAPPAVFGGLLQQVVNAVEEFVVIEAIAAYVADVGRRIGHDQHVLAKLQKVGRGDKPATADTALFTLDR